MAFRLSPPATVNVVNCVPEKRTCDLDVFKMSDSRNAGSPPRTFAIKVFRAGIIQGSRQQRVNELLTDFQAQLSLIPRDSGIVPAAVIDAVTGLGTVKALARPYLEGEIILDYVRANETVDKRRLIIQIAQSLEALHARGIVHGNIYPGNIFVTPGGSACITDTGLHILKTRVTYSLEGRVRVPLAYAYKSRDELNADYTVDGLVQHTTSMDVYSWAATVFAIVSARAPFASQWPTAYIANFAFRGLRAVQKPSQMSDALWELLQKCWDEDPTHRPSMSEVVENLNALRSLT